MDNVPSQSVKIAGIAPAADDPIRILVVDDSAIIRSMITRALSEEKDFKIVAVAANGQLAVDAIKRQSTDVVILDIEMPVMDGLTAIPLLKSTNPSAQIIMASTLTQKNADISLKAMALGATDYIPKPTSDAATGILAQEFNRELIEKVRALGILARRKSARAALKDQTAAAAAVKKKILLRSAPIIKPDVIAIGSSTGGPQALFEVIKKMGPNLNQPILITQHMPPSFTTILAEHITKQCNVTCIEAKDGDIIQTGKYYVAPGGFHMLFTKKPEGVTVRLTSDPPENYCRPAVDPMLRSLVEIYGKKVLAVILTGMGQDGLKGCEAVVTAGGSVIGQDEATSVVWGMPAAVANAGICSSVLPLGEIGSAVNQIAARAI